MELWISLPGIGRTIADSIISSKFDLPTSILDGNVKRIFSRLLARDENPIENERELWEFSCLLISTNNPRNFNQASKDFGTIILYSLEKQVAHFALYKNIFLHV